MLTLSQTDFSDLANRSEDRPGILKSRDYINDIISKESASSSIPSSRIILGGFSQGGAMSLFTGLTTTTKLGGVFGLSSYLLLQPNINEFTAEAKGANLKTPFLMGHGDSDPLVKYDWGQTTANKIREMGYQLDFKTYE